MATVSSSPRVNPITLASATAGPFEIGFRLFESDAVAVYVNGALQSSGYTISASFTDGYDDNATITFATALAVADQIMLIGDMVPQRAADYLNTDGLLVKKLNIELGRVWAALSEVRRGVLTSLRTLDVQEVINPTELSLIGLSEDGSQTLIAAESATYYGAFLQATSKVWNYGGLSEFSAAEDNNDHQDLPDGKVVDVAGAGRFEKGATPAILSDWGPNGRKATLNMWGTNLSEGVTDMFAPLTSALTSLGGSGIPLHLRAGEEYLIDGAFTCPADIAIIGKDATLKMAGPFNLGARNKLADMLLRQTVHSNTQVTLKADTLDGLDLRRVKVDINGDGTNGGAVAGINGAIATAYGMQFLSLTNSHLEDIEAFGHDSVTAIQIKGLNDTNRVIRPYVHDLFVENDSATDDNIQGIDVWNCVGLDIISPRARNAQVRVSGVTAYTNNRMLVFRGNTDVRTFGARASFCGQGIDNTGSDGNFGVQHNGPAVANCAEWGIKVANISKAMLISKGIARDCGMAGFVDSSNFDTAQPNANMNIFEDCLAVRCGQVPTDFVAQAAFARLPGGRPYRVSTRWVRCRAIDDGAVPKMRYAFFNDAGMAATDIYRSTWEDCESDGATVAEYYNRHETYAELLLSSTTNQPIPDTVDTPLVWNVEVEDSAVMHDPSTNPDRVTIREDGDYLVEALLVWEQDATATGIRRVTVRLNGSQVDTATQKPNGTQDDYQPIETVLSNLKAGDYITIYVSHTKGSNQDVRYDLSRLRVMRL